MDSIATEDGWRWCCSDLSYSSSHSWLKSWCLFSVALLTWPSPAVTALAVGTYRANCCIQQVMSEWARGIVLSLCQGLATSSCVGQQAGKAWVYQCMTQGTSEPYVQTGQLAWVSHSLGTPLPVWLQKNLGPTHKRELQQVAEILASHK